MQRNGNWTLGLIDSAWFGSDYEGKRGREEAKRIGFESLDLFVGFDPEKMGKTERKAYITENLSTGLPVISLVCTCLGLSDFNPAIRGYHIERAKNVIDLAATSRQPEISVSCPANICSRRSSSRPRANGTW